MNELTVMKYTFNLPNTGEISLEGTDEDLRLFLMMLRGCIVDAITYNADYCHFQHYAKHLQGLYDSLPDPSPYADPTLDLPF